MRSKHSKTTWPFWTFILFAFMSTPGDLEAQGESRLENPPVAESTQETCQYRLFAINRGSMERFTEAWRDGVYPLRLRHGFTIPVAWAIPETNQFVWLLCYEGPEGFEAKDAAYYASDERVRLSPDPVQFIASAQRWFVEPVVVER